MEINQNIYENMNVENIEPYMPANGTEGDIFQIQWCKNCNKNLCDYSRNGCEILAKAYCDDQPTEWIYCDGKPTCTAFEESIDLEM